MAAEVTVVIPTHNRRAILADTVANVLAEQRVPIEVVVVDDASTDGSYEWLSTVADPRLRAIRLDPGRGGSGARNVGFGEVRTPYVMFMDDDDLLKDNAIPTLLRALTRRPKAVGSAGTYVTFGGGKQIRQPTTRFPVSVALWREEVWGWNAPPGASIFRTEFVREMGGWDEDLKRCEDLDFNLRTYPHLVAMTPATVLRYRRHAGQIQGPMLVFERELDLEVRTKFVAGLPAADRALGERTLEARALFEPTMDLYVEGDFKRAAAGLRRVLRTAPWVARSPVLGPWVLGLVTKATLGSAAPDALLRSIRKVRQARRSTRLDELAKP